MIINHLWGLYTHPEQEWRDIEHNHDGFFSCLTHICLIALIPAACCYFSTAHIGWQVGTGDPIYLTQSSALKIAAAMYVTLIAGVLTLAYLTTWMAKTFGATPSYTQALELAAYTATPIFMTGFAALYPQLWFLMVFGLFGVAYSVYLLYSGMPILMKIPSERGFIYATSVVTCALVLLVAIMTGSVILWSYGFAPSYLALM